MNWPGLALGGATTGAMPRVWPSSQVGTTTAGRRLRDRHMQLVYRSTQSRRIPAPHFFGTTTMGAHHPVGFVTRLMVCSNSSRTGPVRSVRLPVRLLSSTSSIAPVRLLSSTSSIAPVRTPVDPVPVSGDLEETEERGEAW